MRPTVFVLVAGALASALLGSGCERDVPGGAPVTGSAGTPGAAPAVVAPGATMIEPEDYAGPASCEKCHKERFAAWQGHPHRRMNQDASPESVRGDFSGIKIPYAGGTVAFATEGATYTMALERGAVVRKYRITRSVGSRFMQFYVGVETQGPEPASASVYKEEQKLPFGYWFKLKRWLPVSYFDPVGPETKPDGSPAYDPYDSPRVHFWRQNCMLCHNTIPYLERLALPDGLDGFPEIEHQLAVQPLLADLGKVIDLAPRADEPASVKLRIQPKNLLVLGVSCEACHFGAKEHVRSEGNVATSYLPESPLVRWVTRKEKKPVASDTKSAQVMNGICAQCHCATVTRFPNGAGTWNSREALDMIGGACASKIRCIDCHDPHKNDGQEGLATSAAHVEVCTKCHAELRDPAAAKAHAHHDAKDASCLDCHMPRMTQGLEEVVRTHRISSPTDVRMLEKGSGNACNLCHLDKPIGWTLDQLRSQYGKDVAPTTSWSAFYGEKLERPVGLAWLHGADPSMRLVAMSAYARSPLGKAAVREVIAQLDDPVAVNRVFGTFALSRILGREVGVDEFDVTAPQAQRAPRIEGLLAHAGN